VRRALWMLFALACWLWSPFAHAEPRLAIWLTLLNQASSATTGPFVAPEIKKPAQPIRWAGKPFPFPKALGSPKDVAVNDRSRNAAFYFELGTGESRLWIVDLTQSKKLLEIALPSQQKLLAINDSGTRLLLHDGNLQLVEIQEKDLKPIQTWAEGAPKWGAFVSDTLIVAGDKDGVRSWDVASSSALPLIAGQGRGSGGLSPTRTHVAAIEIQMKPGVGTNALSVMGTSTLSVVDIETKVAVATFSLPDRFTEAEVLFSPSGTRVAVLTNMRRLLVYDLVAGRLLSSITLADSPLGLARSVWPHDDFLLAGGVLLVEVEHGIWLWEYEGAKITFNLGDQVGFVGDSQGHSGFLLLKTPTAAAREQLAEALKQPKTWVVAPGMKCQVDVSGISNETARQVALDHLNKCAKDNGLEVVDRAPLVLAATQSTGSQNVEVKNIRTGDKAVGAVRTTGNAVTFYLDGKRVWSAGFGSGGVIPGAPVSGKTAAEGLAKLNREDNGSVFSFITIPKYVKRPDTKPPKLGVIPKGTKTFGFTNITARLKN
jgi:hypothetical protein